ncbi:MAG: hypothetical protein WBG95_10605 [Sulfitobacter sp.]
MTRKIPRSAWTARGLIGTAGVLLAVVFTLGVMLSPPRMPSVAVIGDRADGVRAAMGITQGAEPTVTVVLLHRWDNLRHLPDIAALCWRACLSSDAAQISITQMRFGKTRKVVIFHLPDFDIDCIAARAVAEVEGLRVAAPSCRTAQTRLQVWVLPMGLGRIS